MGRGVQRFTKLRAWQTCDTYKKAVYRLCLDSPLSKDWHRRDELERSVAGPPANIAEGFGRFNPPDFARYTVIARASLMESQNHLLDAVDKQYITEETRHELNALAEAALQEVTGLMEYCSRQRRSRMPASHASAESRCANSAGAQGPASKGQLRKRSTRTANQT